MSFVKIFPDLAFSLKGNNLRLAHSNFLCNPWASMSPASMVLN